MYYKIEYIKQGKLREIIIKAKDINEAIKIFKDKKLGILKDIVEYEKEDILSKILKKFESKKIDLEEFVFILNQLYVMLDAGLGVDIAIENVLEAIKDKKLKVIFESILRDIQAGGSLTEAFKKYEEYLGNLTISMVQLGEEIGDIAGSIKELATILENILENRRRLKKAIRYPMFIIFAMSIAFVIVILFVIPPFKSMFMQLKTQLPLPTRFLLFIEHAIVAYGMYILVGAIIVYVVINYLYKRNYKVKFLLDKLMLKIYIVGDVIYLAMLGRFVYVFEKLVEAGVPIVNALEISLNIVDNAYLKKHLLKIKDSVISGGSISKGLEESTLFEKMIIQIIKAGEGSGALVQMLRKVSNYYITKYKDIVDNISTLIEPILIAAIAGFVLTLALGIFLPMWNLTEAIQ